jgi:hypothetical protein
MMAQTSEPNIPTPPVSKPAAETTKVNIKTSEPVATFKIVKKPTPTVSQTPVSSLQTEQAVREYFKDIPILAEVARCESTFRQQGKDGNVLRGVVNGSDLGVMQINEYYHQSTAAKKGFNLHTLEGNMAYGRDLYMREGLKPWAPSAPCWSKMLNVSGEVAVR